MRSWAPCWKRRSDPRAKSTPAFIEIQVGRSRTPSKDPIASSEYLGNALREIWRGLFGDLGLDDRRLGDAQRFTFAVLSGVAAEVMLFPGSDFTRRHLEILEETLLRLLDVEPSTGS